MAFFSPEDVEGYEFLLSVPGYNRAEVRAFLQALAAQLRETEGDAPLPTATVRNHQVDEARVDEAQDAIGELIRGAEIHIENVANRVVGEFEAVRAEVAQLLRALDLAAQRTRVDETPAAQQSDSVISLEADVAAEIESDEDLVAAQVTPEPRERIEMPPDWDDLFAEPRIDPSP
jgi:DivIVA domain-containing protein